MDPCHHEKLYCNSTSCWKYLNHPKSSSVNVVNDWLTLQRLLLLASWLYQDCNLEPASWQYQDSQLEAQLAYWLAISELHTWQPSQQQELNKSKTPPHHHFLFNYSSFNVEMHWCMHSLTLKTNNGPVPQWWQQLEMKTTTKENKKNKRRQKINYDQILVVWAWPSLPIRWTSKIRKSLYNNGMR